jgi:hypothetical protein
MGGNFSPRYYQIVLALRECICHQRAHDPLPLDTDLCAEFGLRSDDCTRCSAESSDRRPGPPSVRSRYIRR